MASRKRRKSGGKRPPHLSLVVPLYNEEDNIGPLVAATVGELEALDGELILVDDGSTDGSLERIRQAAEGSHRVHGVALRRHFGKGAALAAGLARARGDRLATLDGDLQEDPSDLPRLLAGLGDDCDLITGWRRQRRDPWSKRIASRFFNACVRMTTGLRVHDLNCGFKVMTREVAAELALTGGRFRFIPLLAHWWGFRVAEMEVTHRPRARGRSHFGSERVGAFIDLAALVCLIRYHSRPGHLFIQTGGVSTLAGVGICAYIAWLRISAGTIGFRYPLLALGVLLLVLGVQLLATGFLGEWLFFQQRGPDPGYRVKWESRASTPGEDGTGEVAALEGTPLRSRD